MGVGPGCSSPRALTNSRHPISLCSHCPAHVALTSPGSLGTAPFQRLLLLSASCPEGHPHPAKGPFNTELMPMLLRSPKGSKLP